MRRLFFAIILLPLPCLLFIHPVKENKRVEYCSYHPYQCAVDADEDAQVQDYITSRP